MRSEDSYSFLGVFTNQTVINTPRNKTQCDETVELIYWVIYLTYSPVFLKKPEGEIVYQVDHTCKENNKNQED